MGQSQTYHINHMTNVSMHRDTMVTMDNIFEQTIVIDFNNLVHCAQDLIIKFLNISCVICKHIDDNWR